MAFCLGLGEIHLAFMHLLCHAFFKAGMFLRAGSLISYNLGNQSFRKFNPQRVMLSPAAFLSLLVGRMSLIGIPGTAGYASKESIVAVSYRSTSIPIVILMVVRVLFTISYSARIVKGLMRGLAKGEFGLSKSYETIKLSFPGLILVGFGLIGGELVVSMTVNNCYFEAASSGEAWVSPYSAILIGYLVAVLVRRISNNSDEEEEKESYRMTITDSISRRLLSDSAAEKSEEGNPKSDNVAETSLPQGIWHFAITLLSGIHNVVQRVVVPSTVAGQRGGRGTVLALV